MKIETKIVSKGLQNVGKNQCVFEQSGPEEENYFTMGVGTYNYTFKSVVFESVKVKSVKIKNFLRSLRMVQKIICEKI